MTTLAQIQQFAQCLGESFSTQRVILFDSYAYGEERILYDVKPALMN